MNNRSGIALIIIDVINDFKFKHGASLAKKTTTIANNIHYLKKKLRKNNYPIIYVNDCYHLKQANMTELIAYCRNDHSKPIIDCLHPTEYDYFLLKPKHSAFYGTSLDNLLHQLNIRTLILTGIAGNICVLFTANDAYMREYNLFIPSDCTASNDNHDNDYALQMMSNVLKANIEPSLELMKFMQDKFI